MGLLVAATPGAKAGGKGKESVGARFKGQLSELVSKLDVCSPHFIRCIKPNTKLVPHAFDHAVVLQQLRRGCTS
jgi:myosin-5